MSLGYTIIVHGGAEFYTDSQKMVYVQAVTEAAKEGLNAMKEKESAVDGVVAAVKYMEDNPLFNAGYGSCLNEDGNVEMDAMVMDGDKNGYGAVASVKIVKNPVLLALEVMNTTSNCMLVGKGADNFARNSKIPLCEDPTELITDAQRKIFQQTPRFEDWLTSGMDSGTRSPTEDCTDGSHSHDTVGCVALDCHGRLACATSTGGINGKKVGRVGDSSVVGCGGFANENGAAVATGHGEALLRSIACGRAVQYIEDGNNPTEAIVKVLKFVDRLGSKGGLISINSKGEIGHCYTTGYMPWVAIMPDGKVMSSADTPNPKLS